MCLCVFVCVCVCVCVCMCRCWGYMALENKNPPLPFFLHAISQPMLEVMHVMHVMLFFCGG